MPFYHKLGDMPRKKHTTFYKPDGTLYREELVSTRGFSSIYSNKYHLWEPTKAISIKELTPPEDVKWTNPPLQNIHFYTDKLERKGDFLSSRIEYMHNNETLIHFGRPNQNADYFYKNIYAHEYIFVHRGSGVLKSEYGNLRFTPWDQIIIPMGTIYQLVFDNPEADNKIMVVESDSAFTIPRHYRNEYGQLEEHAPYEERDFKFPDEIDPQDKKGEFRIVIKAKNRFIEYIQPHHPFDVVGYDGYLFPFAFNMKDYNPKTGRIHLPPPIHLVFITKGLVLCNFNPRYFDWHEQAIPAPYFHSNVESTEILYYVEGDFMSRSGVDVGSVTMHPMGIPHGPQPGKTEASVGKNWTDEYAVMVDTFGPLFPTTNVDKCQDVDYWKSWLK